MKLPVSAREVARFTPVGCEQLDPSTGSGPPVYLIATPTLMERARMRREIAAEGATYWSDADLFAALKRACGELFPPDDAADKRGLVDAFAAAQDAALAAAAQLAPVAEDADEELRRPLVEAAAAAWRDAAAAEGPYRELERLAIREVPAFAALLADRRLWLEIAPLIAARLFLRGWENVDLPFQKVGGLVSEECLEALPPEHVPAIGWAAINRQQLSGQAAKN